MGIVRDPLLGFFSKYKDVDIFCLQEIYKSALGSQQHPEYQVELELFERIQEVLRESHEGYFQPSATPRYGIAMFVRKTIPVLEEGAVFIYENKEWREGSERGNHSRNLQYVRIQVNGHPLFLAHAHGLWRQGTNKMDLPERIEQSNRIVDFLARFNEPKVLAGDFNLNPGTQSISILERGMKNLIKEHSISSTRTSFYKKEGKFADYIFVSPGVQVAAFKILPDEVSDHAALYLELGT